jgi:hypothetical protein
MKGRSSSALHYFCVLPHALSSPFSFLHSFPCTDCPSGRNGILRKWMSIGTMSKVFTSARTHFNCFIHHFFSHFLKTYAL